MRLLVCTSAALGLTLVCAALWLRPFLVEAYDVDVRTVPRQTHSGRLLEEERIGQGFRCPAANLERIEVALAPLDDRRGEVELLLRAGGPDGPLVRRSRASSSELAAGGGGFLAFEFEPVETSAGQDFFCELVPSAAAAGLSAWVRYRGQPGDDDRPWGNLTYPGPTVDGTLRSDHPWLRAIAIAVDTLDVGAGPVELELFDEYGELVRRVAPAPALPVRTGYAFFPFEPIPDSRWRNYRFRLQCPETTRVIANAEGPSFFALHAEPRPRTGALLGMTVGGRLHEDRDLFLRVRCARSWRDGLEVLRARLGGRGLAGFAAWVVAIALLLRGLLPGRRPEARSAPD